MRPSLFAFKCGSHVCDPYTRIDIPTMGELDAIRSARTFSTTHHGQAHAQRQSARGERVAQVMEARAVETRAPALES